MLLSLLAEPRTLWSQVLHLGSAASVDFNDIVKALAFCGSSPDNSELGKDLFLAIGVDSPSTILPSFLMLLLPVYVVKGEKAVIRQTQVSALHCERPQASIECSIACEIEGCLERERRKKKGKMREGGLVEKLRDNTEC